MQTAIHMIIHILGAIAFIGLLALPIGALLAFMERDWRECNHCGHLFRARTETWICPDCEAAQREKVTREFQEAAERGREDQNPNRMEVNRPFKRKVRASRCGRFRI